MDKDLMRTICFAIFLCFGVATLLAIAVAVSANINLWTSALYGQAELRRADWNRQIQVREAQAKMDSSKLLAQAEVERAKGVAQANKIIGDSLKDNEGYLRYLWIDSLQHTSDKIIYVPTENGLPILESTRLLSK